MICICGHEIETVTVVRNVLESQTIDLRTGEPVLLHSITYESAPNGYRFRCGKCNAEIKDKRFCNRLFKKVKRNP